MSLSRDRASQVFLFIYISFLFLPTTHRYHVILSLGILAVASAFSLAVAPDYLSSKFLHLSFLFLA